MPTQLDIFRDDNRSVELAEFLSREDTGCLATTDGVDAFIAVCFFVYENGRLFFKSGTASRHSTHLRSRAKSSFSVYCAASTYDAKYGAQLLGTATRIRDVNAMRRCVQLYGDRFAGSAAKFRSIEELCGDEVASTFYQFMIERFKILDEDNVHKRTMLNYEEFQHSTRA